jgi:hypothetical protein
MVTHSTWVRIFPPCVHALKFLDDSTDAVWQLVGLSTWVVGFVEKLLKECVLASDLNGPRDQDDDLFASEPCAYIQLLLLEQDPKVANFQLLLFLRRNRHRHCCILPTHTL